MNYKYTQLKIYIFCFVLTSAFIWMLTHYSTGYFSIDDSEYHFMVKAFCDNGKFSLDNGYEQFPSKELTLNLPFDQPMIENNGKLFPKITPLYPLIAAPFYLLFKIKGLVFLNIISFILSFYFIYKISYLSFKDKDIAITGCYFALLGTYIYEYAVGIWPHSLNLLFILTSCYLSINLISQKKNKKSFIISFILGFILFFNLGIRMDSIVTIVIILSYFILFADNYIFKISAILLGGIIPLSLISIINHIRQDTFNIISYYKNVSNINLVLYLLLGMILLALIRITLKKINYRKFLSNHYLFYFMLLSLLIIIFIYRGSVIKLISGTYILLTDLCLLPDHQPTPRNVFLRNSLGGIINLGTYKKALFQNCPHLIVTATAVILIFKEILKKKLKLRDVFLLITIPTAYICYFGYYRWVGGWCFNLRYFIPGLPFLSILASWYLKKITLPKNCKVKMTSSKRKNYNSYPIKISIENKKIYFISIISFCVLILTLIGFHISKNHQDHLNIAMHIHIIVFAILLSIIIHFLLSNILKIKDISYKNGVILYLFTSIIFIIFYKYEILTLVFKSISSQHKPIIMIPTIFAIMLFICSSCGLFSPTKFRNSIIILFISCLCLSQSLTYLYDLRTSTIRKNSNYNISIKLNRFVSDNSIIISDLNESVFGLKELKKDIFFASPLIDDFKDFYSVIDYFLNKGRNIYIIPDYRWKQQMERIENEYSISKIPHINNCILYQIKSKL